MVKYSIFDISISEMKYRAYIDIETTGLSRRYADLTVIGIALEKDEQYRVVQLLEADLSDERLLAVLDGVDELYSYNGSRFDLPFIRAKLGVDLRTCFNALNMDLHSVPSVIRIKEMSAILIVSTLSTSILSLNRIISR